MWISQFQFFAFYILCTNCNYFVFLLHADFGHFTFIYFLSVFQIFSGIFPIMKMKIITVKQFFNFICMYIECHSCRSAPDLTLPSLSHLCHNPDQPHCNTLLVCNQHGYSGCRPWAPQHTSCKFIWVVSCLYLTLCLPASWNKKQFLLTIVWYRDPCHNPWHTLYMPLPSTLMLGSGKKTAVLTVSIRILWNVNRGARNYQWVWWASDNGLKSVFLCL